MKTKIPERIEIKCDVCTHECTKKNYKQEGQIIVKRDALDFSGHAVADGTVKLDVCDDCLQLMADAINKVKVVRRQEAEHE